MDFFLPNIFIRRFKNNRHIVEPWIIHDPDKNIFAKIPFADAFMAVDTRGKPFTGIIQVKSLQVGKPDNPVEFPENPFVSVFLLDIIT